MLLVIGGGDVSPTTPDNCQVPVGVFSPAASGGSNEPLMVWFQTVFLYLYLLYFYKRKYLKDEVLALTHSHFSVGPSRTPSGRDGPYRG